MPFLIVMGILIACVGILEAIGVYGQGTSAIHQIYAAVLIMTAAVGLLITTVAAAAKSILGELRNRA